MKRSEINDHIFEEIKEYLEKRQYSNETDEKYWRRRSASILDMLLGFGILPPSRMKYIDMENGNTLCSEDCSWEPEDEKK